MTASALGRYFWLSLRLNFRSRQAIVYGYFVPFLFLVAYASVFRADTPILGHEMGELLTLTVLGGTCFGLPTALVAERERGVWKRYRLLPLGTGWLLLTTVAARVVIVLSAIVIQLGLARVMYGSAWPLHPAQEFIALTLSILSFAGLGLLVAAIANDVPSVQALGQCLFLPMVMLGGVGIPLAVLPRWAQVFAAFMPGRYSVEFLQAAYASPSGWNGTGFSVAALIVIGVAASIAGVKLFRWESGRARGRAANAWLACAFAGWIAIGVTAVALHRTGVVDVDSFASITDDEIRAISYDDLPGDNELATRLAPPFLKTPSPRVQDFLQQLRAWRPGRIDDVGQRTRNLVSIAAIADISADPLEAEIARGVFDQLVTTTDESELKRALAWIVVSPDQGTVFTTAPELGLRRKPSERLVRERSALYAKKYLGRLTGYLRDP